MADVFVYAPDCTDFENIGEAGSLTPTSCIPTEIANGMWDLELVHPIDEMGKWSYLQNGYILIAEVPVRTLPEIGEDGVLVTSVENWTVRLGATKGERRVFSKATGGKVKSTTKNAPKPGAVVTVVAKGDTRYKIKFRKGSGWIAIGALENKVDVTIPATPAGIEEAVPAWDIRPQRFRIYKVEKTDAEVTVLASHIFYDQAANVTSYKADNPTCVEALAGLIAGRIDASTEVVGRTNIDGRRVGVDWTRTPFVEALLDPDTGLVPRWGAKLIRDDEEFCVLADAGIDRGMTIEYGKNLVGVQLDLDYSQIVTRYIPVGQTSKGKPLELAAGTYSTDHGTIVIPAGAKWVDASNIGDYPLPMMQVLDLGSEAKAAGTSTAQVRAARVKMIDACLYMWEREQTNYPSVTLNVDFVQLGDTEEFAQYKQLESLFMFDPVIVRHPGVDIDIRAEVVEIAWDSLNDRAEKITIGNVNPQNFGSKLPSWQLPPKIPGTLIGNGTMTSQAFADGAVNSDALDTSQLTSQQTVEWLAGVVTGVTAEQAEIHGEVIDQSTVPSIKTSIITALTAKINEIVAGSVTTDLLYAAMADIIALRVDRALAGTVITDELRASLATIANAQIGIANIDFSQIKDLIAGTAIITEGVGGKLYISRLAVSEANMVSMTVGELMVKGDNGKFYRVGVDGSGNVITTEVAVEGDNIANGTIPGGKLIESSITTRELNADQIFGDSAIIGQIVSGIITTGTLTASEAFVTQLTASTAFVTSLFASSAFLQRLQVSAAPRTAALPAAPVVGQSVIYTGVTPNEYLQWTGNGINPTQRRYSASQTGASVVIPDLSDDRALSVTVKTVASQAGSGTPSPDNVRAISGKSAVAVRRFGTNMVPSSDLTANLTGWNNSGAVISGGACVITGIGDELNGSSEINSNSAYRVAVVEGHAYTASVHVTALTGICRYFAVFYDKNNASVGSGENVLMTGTGRFSKATTAPVGAVSLQIFFRCYGSGSNMTINRPQVELGSVASVYEPYGFVDFALTPDSMLYGLTGFEDEIGNDGHVAHRTTLLALTETQGWLYNSSFPATNPLFARFTLTGVSTATSPAGVCSHFSWTPVPDTGTSSEVAGGNTGGNQFSVYILKSRMAGWSDGWTDVQKANAFKTWLTGKGVQVVVRLAAPVTATVAPVQINGVDGPNTVTSDGASVTVDYTGSGWAAVGAVQRLAVEAVSISPEEGLRVDTVLTSADGTHQVSTYFNARGTKYGLFRASDGKLLNGATVTPDGQVVGVVSAIIDPDSEGNAMIRLESERLGDAEELSLNIVRGNRDLFSITGIFGVDEFLSTLMHSDLPIQIQTYSDYGWADLYLGEGHATLTGTNLDGSTTHYIEVSAAENRIYASRAITVPSDANKKQNIQPLGAKAPQTAEALIMALQPCQYEYRGDEDAKGKAAARRMHYGFTAQEVKAAMDTCGISNWSAYSDENPDKIGLCYEEFIAPMVAVIQSQQRRIDDLESRLTKLESRLQKG